MDQRLSRKTRALRIAAFGIWAACMSGSAYAHGGGLNAEGCHTNRKTGEYHCHRGWATNAGATSKSSVSPDGRPGNANSFLSGRQTPSGQTCYTGPRGGTYTITASGRKNYGGC
ncbi:MAG: hypothetical protein CL858_20025 [Cupriavidus sp.]|nr:hypothetical protein [Cupriavidus sp.]